MSEQCSHSENTGRKKAFSVRNGSPEKSGNLGIMALLGKLFANKEWRMYLQIHWCLSEEHLTEQPLAWDRKEWYTQNSQAQPSVTFAVLEHCLHGAFPVCSPSDSSWSSNFVFHRPPALPQVHFMVIVNKEQCYAGKKKKKANLPLPLTSSWNSLNNINLTCLSASEQDHFEAYQSHLLFIQLNLSWTLIFWYKQGIFIASFWDTNIFD